MYRNVQPDEPTDWEGEAPAEPRGGRGSRRAAGRARLPPSRGEGEAPAEARLTEYRQKEPRTPNWVCDV